MEFLLISEDGCFEVKPDGCGLPPGPPTRWQDTQLEAAPWSWQPAQLTMSCRAAVPWKLGLPGVSQPAGCGFSGLLESGVSLCLRWQSAQKLTG
jgi:hypothetical protein